MPLSIRRAQPLLASIDAWRLIPAEWSAVDSALEALAQALDTGNQDAAGAALADLAVLSDIARPSRPLQPELASPENGPRQYTKALVDRLVHRLVEPDDAPTLGETSR